MSVNDFAMSRQAVETALKSGLTLSTWLETQDPTSAYPEHERGMDAFQRQLARLDVRTAGDIDTGRVAHTMDRWYDTEGLPESFNERLVLAAEWMSRQFKRGSFAWRSDSRLTDGRRQIDRAAADGGVRFPVDVPLNYTLFPPAVLDQLRFQQVQPSALQYLIARTRMIESETFKALYLTSDSTAQTGARLKRVEEFGAPNVWSFATSENSVSVVKYANSLRLSYEQMRRMQIDMVGWAVSYIAAVADLDKESSAINILINGDGNSGTAATNTNGSGLDSAAGGVLTLKMWLKWRYLWTRPYTNRVTIGTSNSLVDLFLLSAGSANVGPQNYLTNNMNSAVSVTPVRTVLEGVLAVDNSTVASNTLLGIDNSAALEMVLETNSNIVQMDQVINNQFNNIVFSENVGWAVAIKGQARTLAYTA